MPDMGTGEALLLSSIIGGGASLAGGALAPSGQQLESFRGTDVDPEKLLKEYFNKNNLLASDITLQHPNFPDAKIPNNFPTFTGGGLPMPIGLVTNAGKGDIFPTPADDRNPLGRTRIPNPTDQHQPFVPPDTTTPPVDGGGGADRDTTGGGDSGTLLPLSGKSMPAPSAVNRRGLGTDIGDEDVSHALAALRILGGKP